MFELMKFNCILQGKLTGVVGNRLLMIVPVRSEQYSVMGIKRIEYTLPPKGLDPTDTKLTTLIEYKNPWAYSISINAYIFRGDKFIKENQQEVKNQICLPC